MSVWSGLSSAAVFRPHQPRLAAAPPLYRICWLLGLLLAAGLLPGAALAQTTPKPKSQHAQKVQARKARAKAIRAAPTSNADTATTPPPKPLPQAKPGQRAGSAPTPPVRNISLDPRDPVGPPPPGVRNTGQARIAGASHKAVPDTLARPLPGGKHLGLPADTVGRANGAVRPGDSLQVRARRKGQVEGTIKYAAKDSMQFDVTKKVARLYNKASVDYGTTDLKAALIIVNYGQNTMQAEGRLDSVKHRLEGRPVLKDGDGLYTASSIAYNFKSKKAKVTDAVTTQGEGFVSASTIKRLPDGVINGQDGRYTTCNLEHPHFYIQARKMKVIPGEQVVTGPFNLVIGDVPTPLGFLFGFFPTPNKSRGSGVLIPTFGQAADRGYYLANGGYYFAPNDYIGVRLTGDIYAGNAQQFGGFGLTADISYLKRYTYQGNFNLRFANRPNPILPVPPESSTSQQLQRPSATNSFWLTWNHTPVPKPGGGRFSVGITAGTNGYNQSNSFDARRYLATQYTSNISYSKQLRHLPAHYDVKMSQSQGTDGSMRFTLPDVNIGIDRQYPYQWFGIKPGAGGQFGTQFYEQISLSYDLLASNEFSNTVAARSLSNGLPLLGGTTAETRIPVSSATLGQLLRNGRNGMRHNINIGLPSLSVFTHLKLTPGVTYNEVWYGQRLNYTYSPVAQAVRVDTIRSFNRINNYAFSLSANTAFYGTFVRRGVHKIQALRHKVTPSLSYSFSPNFLGRPGVYPSGVSILGGDPNTRVGSDPTTQVGRLRDPYGVPYTDAVLNTYAFNNYNGFLYGTPGGAKSNSLLFNLENALEMKVRDDMDTTGLNPFRKVDVFRTLSFSVSYDWTKPSFKLSFPSVSFSTQLAKKLTLNSNASFDPYQRDSKGTPIDKYLFAADHRYLARLLSANLTANYAFNPASGKKKSVVRRPVAPSNDPSLGAVGGPNYYADYVDFDIPWELNMSYSANYTTNSVPLTQAYLTQYGQPPLFSAHTIHGDGSVKLTPNLRLTYSIGYDLVHNTVTYPTISFFRDLHCWQINGNWTPFGVLKGYNITIAAKSSLLQDLKLNRNRQVLLQ